jgi:hypothetical protein
MKTQRLSHRAKDRQLELLQGRRQPLPTWQQLPSRVKTQTLSVLAQLLSDVWAGRQEGLLHREADDE